MKKPVLAGLVVAATACATVTTPPQGGAESSGSPVTGKKEPATEVTESTSAGEAVGGAVGAVGGAALGALAGGMVSIGCGPFAIICLPVAVLGGGVIGATEGAKTGAKLGQSLSDSASRASPGPPGESAAVASAGAQGTPPHSAPHFASTGTLSISRNSIQRVFDTDRYLVNVLVDLDALGENLEKSYLAHTEVDCRRTAYTVFRIDSYSEKGGSGFRVATRAPEHIDAVENPGPPLDTVVQAVCSEASKN